mgnify:CR=1 FL=1
MYINYMNEENKNIYICYWLLLITLLVGVMIVVGGLTRLTDSGLSITKWDLISGFIPPLNTRDWSEAFDLYKQIPEYKLLNSTMTMSEFKTIYWWEYIHRLLGRIIGLSYLLPLLFFTYKKLIPKKSLFIFYFIFALIFFQGFIGWYMVKSGLTERTDVSHYRLSLHLIIAFFIFILLFWNYLAFKSIKYSLFRKKLPSFLPIVFMLFLLIQITIGAFVSGLDAGNIYQTWPLMNDSFFPDDAELKNLFSITVFDMPSMVQFIHRNIAYLIFLLFIFIFITIYKNNEIEHLRIDAFIILFILICQILLGIFTLISGLNIVLASLHQLGSVFLVGSTTILIFKNSKN